MSGQHHVTTVLPARKSHGTHWVGGSMGPTAGLDISENIRLSRPCREWKPGPSSPQPSRQTVCAIHCRTCAASCKASHKHQQRTGSARQDAGPRDTAFSWFFSLRSSKHLDGRPTWNVHSPVKTACTPPPRAATLRNSKFCPHTVLAFLRINTCYFPNKLTDQS